MHPSGASNGLVRYPVASVPISHLSREDLIKLVSEPSADHAQSICFCNVHSIMSARTDQSLRSAIEASDVAAPDGSPVAWWLQHIHGLAQPRVPGPTTMEYLISHGVAAGWSHYFYGSTDEVLSALTRNLTRAHPGVDIAGHFSPPFRSMSDAEERAIIADILRTRPTIVWVGLGMPKQELWMHRMRHRLPGVTLAGVGAAFDMIAGRTPRAPQWMQDVGLEWLYRLSLEPRRLWRRYWYNNPAFMARLVSRWVLTRVRS